MRKLDSRAIWRLNFGSNLQMLRKNRYMSQEDLANASGVSANSISGYEAAKNEPTALNIVKMAHALNVSTDVLLMAVDDEL